MCTLSRSAVPGLATSGAPPRHTLPHDWVRRPSPARLYNHLLGGKDHQEVDRELAAALGDVAPELSRAAQINRAFGHRAVKIMADRGVRQFLDLGCGLPHEPNLHETAAGAVGDGVRFLYVDHDPHVILHAQALMVPPAPAVAAHLLADLRRIDTVLLSPEAIGTLDLHRPVGVLLHAVLHLIPDDDVVHGLIGVLKGWLLPGGCLSVTHPTADFVAPETAERIAALYEAAGLPLRLRTRQEITELLDGLELLEPGIAPAGAWLPDGLTRELPARVSAAWAAIATVS